MPPLLVTSDTTLEIALDFAPPFKEAINLPWYFATATVTFLSAGNKFAALNISPAVNAALY